MVATLCFDGWRTVQAVSTLGVSIVVQGHRHFLPPIDRRAKRTRWQINKGQTRRSRSSLPALRVEETLQDVTILSGIVQDQSKCSVRPS